jgi:hypothetical protein
MTLSEEAGDIGLPAFSNMLKISRQAYTTNG